MVVQKEQKIGITAYKVACSLCGEKFIHSDKETCAKMLAGHIDNDCKMVKTLKEWDKAGVTKEMIALIREGGQEDSLRKWMKKHKVSIDKTRDILDSIEGVGI